MNDWTKVLEAYLNGKFPEYFYGFTLRFIIGACQVPIGKKFESNELAYSETKKMFEEMQNYNQNGYVVISNKCDIHNGPVMSFSSVEWNEKSIGTTFEEIWDRFGTEIIEGNYHINKNELEILNQIYSEFD